MPSSLVPTSLRQIEKDKRWGAGRPFINDGPRQETFSYENYKTDRDIYTHAHTQPYQVHRKLGYHKEKKT